MEDLSFYNPEGSDLRRAQSVMLGILSVFDEICQRHGITYWLISGTLLGARRHGGFIPWDDDLDVAVRQIDYRRLLKILERELPSTLRLQTSSTDRNYFLHWAKVRDVNSLYYEDSAVRNKFKFQGIFIDIFPIEPVPSLRVKKIIDGFLISKPSFRRGSSVFKLIKDSLRRCLLPVVRLIIFSLRLFYRIYKSETWSYSYGVFYYSKYRMKYFVPSAEIMFEGKFYTAPNDVDGYLFDKFGPSAMQVPDISERRVHASRFEFY